MYIVPGTVVPGTGHNEDQGPASTIPVPVPGTGNGNGNSTCTGTGAGRCLEAMDFACPVPVCCVSCQKGFFFLILVMPSIQLKIAK